MGPLTDAVAVKIQEQMERTVHLITFVPEDRLQWTPISGALPCGQLLGHLLDCLAGICAVLYAAHPERLAHFAELRKLPVNVACGPSEASRRIGVYRAHIEEGFALLSDADLGRKHGMDTVIPPHGCQLLLLEPEGLIPKPKLPKLHK